MARFTVGRGKHSWQQTTSGYRLVVRDWCIIDTDGMIVARTVTKRDAVRIIGLLIGGAK